MPAAHVQHASYLLLAGHYLANPPLIQQLQLGMAETLPQTLLRLQMAHLFSGEGGEHPAILQITLNLILRHPLANDPPALERHIAQQLRLLRANAPLEDRKSTRLNSSH